MKFASIKVVFHALLACLILGSSVLSLRSLKSKVNSQIQNSFFVPDFTEAVPAAWNVNVGRAYRLMAGLGYIERSQMNPQMDELDKGEGQVKDTKQIGYLAGLLFSVQGWEHMVTFTGDCEISGYAYTIIRHLGKKKVVCAFSGTKGAGQLYEELKGSGGVTYFRAPKLTPPMPQIKMMNYFHKIYEIIYKEFLFNLIVAKDPAITQYIFIGHSLGGAIASIAAFDSVKSGTLLTTAISPVLITYGQPRTGNFAFANELGKVIPIVFRHVNKWDIVPTVPACIVEGGKCINEFGALVLSTAITTYTLTTATETRYFPWHIGGLILIVKDTAPEIESSCISMSENIIAACQAQSSFSFEFHTHYFGYKVSDAWKPEYYSYDKRTLNEAEFQTTYPPRKLFEEASKNSFVFRTVASIAGGTTRLFLRTAGITTKKKRLIKKK